MGISECDIAYAAGFVEADGCVYLNSSNISVRVTNRNNDVLLWFGEKFGGVTRQKVNPVGCYEWVIYGDAAYHFINLIYKYLIFKKPQCDIAIKFRSMVGRRGLRLTEDVKLSRRCLLQDLKEEKAKWRSK